MARKAAEQQEINRMLREYNNLLAKLNESEEIVSEDTAVKEEAIETSSEIPKVTAEPVEEMKVDTGVTEVATETAETTESFGVESKDVETSEEKEAVDGDSSEKTEEAEPKGIKASKIEDVVEEEIPAASEENTESEGEVEEPQEEREKKGGDKKTQIAGVTLIDEHTAEIAEDTKRKRKLRVRAVLKKTENRREYQVYEVDSEGNDLATIGSVNTFTASQVRKENARLRETIENFQGDYTEQLSDIIVKIKMIEMKRVLLHTSVNDSDSCISLEEYIEKLGRWFMENINDVRVGVTKIKGTNHIMLVRRGEKTISQIFKSVNKEISEKLDSNYIKGELYKRGLLHCDKNEKCIDTQFTISKDAQERLGSIRDKVMSFVLPDEIAKEIVKRYEEERFTVAIESTEGE